MGLTLVSAAAVGPAGPVMNSIWMSLNRATRMVMRVWSSNTWSPGYLPTCYIDNDDLQLLVLQLLHPQVLRLQVITTSPSFMWY